jgi:hypothetical protein
MILVAALRIELNFIGYQPNAHTCRLYRNNLVGPLEIESRYIRVKAGDISPVLCYGPNCNFNS